MIELSEIDGVLSGATHVAVFTHDFPDPDALASAWGITALVEERYSARARIIFGGFVERAENAAMIRVLDIVCTNVADVDEGQFDRVVLVDTQPDTGNNSLAKDVTVDLVLDHHPRVETARAVRLWDVRSDWGATASVVTGHLQEAGVNVDAKLATALFFGIKTDTHSLGEGATSHDVRWYEWLFSRISHRHLSQIERPALSGEHFRVMARALSRARIYENVVVCHLGEVASPESVGEIVDLLVRRDGVDWAVCTGEAMGAMSISVRASRIGLSARALAGKLVEGIGISGGHAQSAGGRAPVEVRQVAMLRRMITRRTLAALGLGARRGERVFAAG